MFGFMYVRTYICYKMALKCMYFVYWIQSYHTIKDTMIICHSFCLCLNWKWIVTGFSKCT